MKVNKGEKGGVKKEAKNEEKWKTKKLAQTCRSYPYELTNFE